MATKEKGKEKEKERAGQAPIPGRLPSQEEIDRKLELLCRQNDRSQLIMAMTEFVAQLNSLRGSDSHLEIKVKKEAFEKLARQNRFDVPTLATSGETTTGEVDHFVETDKPDKGFISIGWRANRGDPQINFTLVCRNSVHVGDLPIRDILAIKIVKTFPLPVPAEVKPLV